MKSVILRIGLGLTMVLTTAHSHGAPNGRMTGPNTVSSSDRSNWDAKAPSSDVTDTMHGLMTAAQKAKLDGIASGATANVGTVRSIVVSSPLTGGTITDTGTIGIQAATTSVPGYLSSSDKTKLDSVTSGAAVSSVSATSPLVSSGGATPAISLVASTDTQSGYLTSADHATFNAKSDLVLGATSTTAFRGDYGQAAYAASVTNATDSNVISTIVKRDSSGNFSAGTITAALSGNASSATMATTATNVSGTVAVANGGTGATSASVARDNLGVTTALASKASTAVATSSSNGLMASTDKTKLDGVAVGATNLTLGTTYTTAYAGDSGVVAYNDRFKWDGGSSGLVAETGRASLGLNNVDNTSDANKPVGSATQTALNLKCNKASNLSDLTSASAARVNLGLGSAAVSADTEFATAAQGTLASNALPSSSFTDTAVLNKLLAGYSSTTGTLSSSDTLAQAISKLNGNVALKGTVSSVSVTSANGVSGSVATATTTPAITLTLGAITPSSVNSVVVSGTGTPTLAVTGTSSISGSNTGDNAVNSNYSGLVSNKTHIGDVTDSGGTLTVTKINGTSLSSLATGIMKNTTSTGVPSIAAAGDFPTLNQNTTGSSAKWTTARTLAGNSVDGSGNVAFTNKFIIQGTSDSGLSGAQFLGSLGTGLLKNTTSTGILSVAQGDTDYVVPTGVTAGTYKSVTVNSSGAVTTGSNPTTLSGYGITDATPSSHVGATGTAHGAATTSVNGFMSSTDKTKLDGVASGATALALGTTSTTAYAGDSGVTAYNDRFKWDGGSSGLVAATGRSSLGLGTAATTAATAYATAAQGTSADNAYAAAVTNATSVNTSSTIVKRDSSGDFSAHRITASLNGVADESTVSDSCNGNSATATKLLTARAINGVNFDGTAAVTVTAAAGTLSGSTLASGVTASSLTSVGTLNGLLVTGTITASADTDKVYKLGRAWVGFDNVNTDQAVYTHYDAPLGGFAVDHSGNITGRGDFTVGTGKEFLNSLGSPYTYQTIYVDTAGDDANVGSSALPVEHLSEAMARIPEGGVGAIYLRANQTFDVPAGQGYVSNLRSIYITSTATPNARINLLANSFFVGEFGPNSYNFENVDIIGTAVSTSYGMFYANYGGVLSLSFRGCVVTGDSDGDIPFRVVNGTISVLARNTVFNHSNATTAKPLFTTTECGRFLIDYDSTVTCTDSKYALPAMSRWISSTSNITTKTSSDTASLFDADKMIRFNGGSAETYTIAADASVAIYNDAQIDVFQSGAGTLTIDAAAGVTLNGVSGGYCSLTSRYKGATLRKISANVWEVSGAITEVTP